MFFPLIDPFSPGKASHVRQMNRKDEAEAPLAARSLAESGVARGRGCRVVFAGRAAVSQTEGPPRAATIEIAPRRSQSCSGLPWSRGAGQETVVRATSSARRN